MQNKLNAEQIREYWKHQAQTHGTSSLVSWSDTRVIEMEIREIIKRLEHGDSVLDVGCGNGYSTIRYAMQKRVHVRGVDYLPDMVAHARAQLDDPGINLLGEAEFDAGDALALNEPSDAYDKVTAVRVIINLPDLSLQQQALGQCLNVLRPGGHLILSDATRQGWENLNRFRREWGLPDIPMPPFNMYLDEPAIKDFLSERADVVETVDFSSTYYVATRVLKPLLINALGLDLDVSDPDALWNTWFSLLPGYGDFGVQKLFVFRKKDK